MEIYKPFRSTSSAKELDTYNINTDVSYYNLDPQAPRKSLTMDLQKEIHNQT